MGDERVAGRVIDGHSHIGEMAAWKFYDLKEAVKPTVYEFVTPKDHDRTSISFSCPLAFESPSTSGPVNFM